MREMIDEFKEWFTGLPTLSKVGAVAIALFLISGFYEGIEYRRELHAKCDRGSDWACLELERDESVADSFR